MRLYSNPRKTFPPLTRLTTWTLIAALLYGVFLPGPDLLAQTYKSFDQDSRSKVESYLNRAERMESEEAWSNYVELGIATERTTWENEAYDALEDKYRQIEGTAATEAEQKQQKEEARAQFEAARMNWQEDAEELFQEERGRFEARGQAIDVAETTTEQYESLILAAEAAMAGVPDGDLAGWEAAISPGHQAIIDAFEAALTAQIDAARSNLADLTGLELQGFEDEIARIEGETRAEFESRDNFYLVRARNRYISLKRSDEISARLSMDQTSADAVFDAIVGKTIEQLDAETDSVLQSALNETQTALNVAGGDINAVGNDWEAKVEALIESGLRKWEIAEEDLFTRRLAWEEEAKTTKIESNKIWKANHERLQQAMDNWLEKVEEQSLEGRKQWEAKITELQRERQKSETELAEYIQNQREQWLASSEQLAGLVEGGGSALLEAKDAYNYYGDQIALREASGDCDTKICDFYRSERNKLGNTIASFQGILLSTEAVVQARMHSDEGHTGLLNDRRLYAGDLPEQVAAIPVSDYRVELTAHMNAQSEDYVLYRRDILNLIDRNNVFTSRAQDLEASPDFDFNGAASLDAIAQLVGGMDQKFDRHEIELKKILDKEREGTDAEKLAAIKSEIADWFVVAVDENARLKEQTVAYFNDGLGGYLLSDQTMATGEGQGAGGYYTTGQENDPYLMTQAEYEWEILRRERNYLAKKLRRAEEVKHYADLAAQHNAGLELAAITTERAEIAKSHADLKEIIHDLIAGNIDLPASLKGPGAAAAAVAAKADQLLADRGINYAALTARAAQIDTERARLNAVAGYGTGPDEATTLTLIADIDAYLNSRSLQGEDRADHPLGVLREKLQAYRNALAAGDPPAALADRWTILRSGAQVTSDELASLKTSYDFAGITADRQSIIDLIPGKNITEHQGDLKTIKEEIEANSLLLREATKRMEEAKERYHQAFVDYQVIVIGKNQDDLIRVEISQTTDQLSAVLNRMVKVEGASNLCDSGGVLGSCVQDVVSKETIEYLNEISQGEKAAEDYLQASTMLGSMQGLEAAKTRLAALENVIAANNFTGQTPEQIADVWIAAEAGIVDRTSSEEQWRSSQYVRQAMDLIKSDRQRIPGLQSDLAEAISPTDGSPSDPAQVQMIRKEIADRQESILRAVELLVASSRGEVQQRRDLSLFLLEYTAGDGTSLVKPDVLETTHEAQRENLQNLAYELAERASARLVAFLSTNREQSFAQILQTLNDTIAALPPRALDLSQNGYGAAGATLPGDHAEWTMVRDWIVSSRASIDYAGRAPDQYDPRPVADRWDDLLEGVADLGDDATFHRTFEANIPDSAADPRMVNFRTLREGVLTRLGTVLAQPDTGLGAAYQALSLADRQTLETYGAVDDLNPRDALLGMRAGIERDLYRLPREYRELFLREEARANARLLREIEPDLNAEGGRLAGDRLEKATLERDRAGLMTRRATAPPAEIPAIDLQIAQIDARLPVLDARIAALLPVVAALEDQFRQASNVLREARTPGSTSPLFSMAQNQMYKYNRGANILRNSVDLLNDVAYAKDFADENSPPASAVIKGILGVYRTDADGKVMLDANGVGVPNPAFNALNGGNPHADLFDLFGGNTRGTQLETWVGLLQEWVGDSRRSASAPREVLAAVGQLEESLREYLTAKEFIEVTRQGLTTAQIESQATADAQLSQSRLLKLTRVMDLQRQLSEVVQQASQAGADPVSAALKVLEKPENTRLLFLFEGYDHQGQVDGVTDPELQQRVDELRLLTERLRDARLERRITAAAAHYGQFQLQNLDYVNDPSIAIWPNATEFFKAYPDLDGDPVQVDINQIAQNFPNSFRAKLFEYVGSIPEEKALFAGEIAALLGRDLSDGLALKNAVDATMLAMRTRVDDSLAAYAAEVDVAVVHERDLAVKTSVTELLNAYATRGDTARTAYLPELDAVALSMAAPDAKNLLAARADELLSDAIYTTIREQIHRALNTTFEAYEKRMDEIEASAAPAAQKTIERETARVTFLLTAKSQLASALYAVPTVNAQERVDLERELYTRELRKAVTLSDMSPAFDPEAYPEELHAFVLVRQYTRARERYADYLDLRSAATDGERDRASLNLTGLSGDFAESILAEDFANYIGGHPIAAFLAGGEGRRTIDEYLDGYFRDRHTGPQNLPFGGALLGEIVALSEYRRIQADAAGPGLFALDERNYFNDFAPYLMAAKMKDYATRNGLVLPAGTTEDRRAYLAPHFEAFLNDPTYAVAGVKMGDRYPAQATRDQFFGLAFADLSEGPALDQYIPEALAERRLNGKLNEDPPAASTYLPAELLLIPAYATANYRDLAATVSDDTRDALARLETQERAMLEDLSVLLSDAELEKIVVRAGQGAAPAPVRAELVAMLRAMNEQVHLGSPGDRTAMFQAFRQRRVIESLFPGETDRRGLKTFMTAQLDVIDSVENKFFNELEKSSDPLREQAKLYRGRFLRALIEHHRALTAGGTNTAYYNALGAMKPEMDALYDRLFVNGQTALEPEEIVALLGSAQLFDDVFDLRSGQELASSGILEDVERALFNSLSRSAPDDLLAESRAKSLEVTRDFLELILHVRTGGDPNVYIPQSEIIGLGEQLLAALATTDPAILDDVGDEEFMLRRLLNNFMETEADRQRMETLLADPALSQPDLVYIATFETDRAAALAAVREQELAGALMATISDHGRFYEEKQKELSREQYVASSLQKFARDRGTDSVGFTESRFANYRSFIGSERGEQLETYRGYVDQMVFESDQADNLGNLDTPDSPRTNELRAYLNLINATADTAAWTPRPVGVKNFYDFFAGRALETENMNRDPESLIMNANWQNDLTSDNPNLTAGTVQLPGDPNDSTDDAIGAVRRVKTIMSVDQMGTGGNIMRRAYFASLANNYLDRTSALNASLNNVFLAAKMADARKSTETDQAYLARMRSAYDARATAATSTTGLQNLQVDAQTRKADHDEAKISAARSQISGQKNILEKAADSFAQASRRRLIQNNALDAYITNVMTGVSAEMNAATAAVTALETTATDLRNEYSDATRAYTGALNAMSDAYRDFTRENEEYEMRQAVREYAETPYLFNLNEENDQKELLEKQRGDADKEFELALGAYDDVQGRLKDAGYRVMAQDDLARLDRLATLLASVNPADAPLQTAARAPLGDTEREQLFDLRERSFRNHETLSAADAQLLNDLTDREMVERYEDLLVSRQEYIAHTMRMVRLQKVSEIISPEIERRRAKAEMKRQELENALNEHFGVRSEHAENESALEARNAVYMRLSGVVGGGGDLYNEYRSWYWGRNQYLESMFEGYAEGVAWGQPVMPEIYPSQIYEGMAGVLVAAGMPGADRGMLNTWMDYGGTFAEFGNWSGIYYGFMQSLGVHDMMKMEKEIITAIQSVVMGIGMALVASGTAMVATIVFAGQGAAQIAIGRAMVQGASKQIAQANLKYMIAQIYAVIMQVLAYQAAQDKTAINEIDAKRAEYEQSLAELEYFTKVPDLNTLKDRVVAFGANRPDNFDTDPANPSPLYTVTTEDLQYLVERDAAGNLVYPPGLTPEEQSETLDVGVKKRVVEYHDAFGRRYDPDITAGAIQRMEGGKYWDAQSNDYVKVRALNTAGFATGDTFKKFIPESDTRQHKAYDMGEVMTLAVAHGNQLREDRRQKYLTRGGELDDQSFALHDRDLVMSDLFAKAAARRDGGREYSGYRMAFTDYDDNSADVFAREISQRQSVQRVEWDLREKELSDAYSAWDDKVKMITKRGREAWSGALDRFTQRWRTWERDYDQEVAAGKAEWDQRVQEHFTAKNNWETGMRTQLQQATVQNTLTNFISNLNASISGLNAYSGTSFDQIDRTQVVNSVMDELRAGEPGHQERLKRINEGIKGFNTNLSQSELSVGDFLSGSAGVAADFQTAMADYKERMKIVANVKAFEQYRMILDNLRDQIRKRNEAVSKQTAASAYAAGFVMSAGKFVKFGASQTALWAVDPYQWFNGEAAIQSELGKVGLDQGSLNSGNVTTSQLLSEGNELVNFLSGKSEVEVSSFFYVQQLAMQTVTDRIMGRGRASERETSRDETVIGTLGAHIGAAPNQTAGRLLTMAGAESGAYSRDAEARDLVYQYGLAGGFGELGSGTARPSGIYLGFYVQLQYGSQYIEKENAKAFENAGGTLDPLSTAFQQINPIVMMANSYQNVALYKAHKEHRLDKAIQKGAADFKTAWEGGPESIMGSGMNKQDAFEYAMDPFGKFMGDRGLPVSMLGALSMDKDERYMWEAQGLAMMKGIIGIVPLIGQPIASGIKVDTRTGEREYKYTDQDRDNLKASLFGIYGDYWKSGREYDEEGNYERTRPMKKMGGREGTADFLRSILGQVPIIGQTLAEYGVRQTAGREYSNYDQMYKPDMASMGNVASLVLLILAAAEGGSGAAETGTAAAESGSLAGELSQTPSPGGALSIAKQMLHDLINQEGANALRGFGNLMMQHGRDQLNFFNELGGNLRSLFSKKEDDPIEQIFPWYSLEGAKHRAGNLFNSAKDGLFNILDGQLKKHYGALANLPIASLFGELGWMVKRLVTGRPGGTAETVREQRAAYDRGENPGNIREIMASVLWMNESGAFTDNQVRGELDHYYRNGKTVQDKLMALGAMSESGLYETDDLKRMGDELLSSANGVERVNVKGMEGYIFKGKTGQAHSGEKAVYVHGLRSDGDGRLGAIGIVGNYYNQVDIQDRIDQGYDVIFVNGPGRASNEESSATIALQLAEYRDKFDSNPSGKYHFITHSRGAHDLLGVMTNAAAQPEYAAALRAGGNFTEADIKKIIASNQAIAGNTANVYFTSAALQGPVTGTIANNSILTALSYVAPNMSAGFPYNMRSDGQRSLTNSETTALYNLYEKGAANFTADVTMIAGNNPGFGGGGTGGEKLETTLGGIMYAANPLNWFSIASGMLGFPGSDGAVGVDGQLNLGAIASFHNQTRGSISLGQTSADGRSYIQDKYSLNHGGTRDDRTMMKDIFNHMDGKPVARVR